MSDLIHRSPIQKLFEENTIKILNHDRAFLGTGFYVLPNAIASCNHVFCSIDTGEIVDNFYIDGQDELVNVSKAIIHRVKGLDLIIIEFENDLYDKCLCLETDTPNSKDELWGYSHNVDYNNVGVVSIFNDLAEHIKHPSHKVYIVEDDAIAGGSSGTPLLNVKQNKFFGVVYWWREEKEKALVIPAQYFKEHFSEIFERNVEFHKKSNYWHNTLIESRAKLLLCKNDATHKVLCLFDNNIREYYESIQVFFEDKKEKILVHGLTDISENIDEEAITLEMQAANIIVLLIDGNRFVRFWNDKLSFLDLNTYCKDKKIIFVAIEELSEGTLKRLCDNLNVIPTDKIPKKPKNRWQPKCLSITSIDIAIEEIFAKEFNEIIHNYDSLKREVQKFDLVQQTHEFRELFKDNKNFNLIFIEGDDNSGQELLFKRNLLFLGRRWTKVPHVKKIFVQQKKITSVESFWQALSYELTQKSNLRENEINENILKILQQENLVILIDDILDKDNNKESGLIFNEIISEFWKKFQALNENSVVENQLFVFVVSRVEKEVEYSLLNSSISGSQNGLFQCMPLSYIEKVTELDLEKWNDDLKGNDVIYSLLNTKAVNIKNIFPDNLENVLINLKPYFNLSASEIESIKNY